MAYSNHIALSRVDSNKYLDLDDSREMDIKGEEDGLIVGIIVRIQKDSNGDDVGDGSGGNDLSENVSDGEVSGPVPNGYDDDEDDNCDNLNETFSDSNDDDTDDDDGDYGKTLENKDTNAALAKRDDDTCNGTHPNKIHDKKDGCKKEPNVTCQERDVCEIGHKEIGKSTQNRTKKTVRQQLNTEDQECTGQEKSDNDIKRPSEILDKIDHDTKDLEQQSERVEGQQGWKLKRENPTQQEKNKAENISQPLRYSLRKHKQVFYDDLEEKSEEKTDVDETYKVSGEPADDDDVNIEKETDKRLQKMKQKKIIGGADHKEVLKSVTKDGIKRKRKKRIRRKHQCTVCGKLVNDHYMAAHMNNHAGVLKHICEVCGKSYAHTSSLRAHTRIRHKSRERFPCSVCGVQFASLHYTRNHEKTMHKEMFPGIKSLPPKPVKKRYQPKEKSLQCSYIGCDKMFLYKGQRKDHEASAHRGEVVRSLSCTICMKTFGSPSNKRRHMITHRENPRPYICSHCPAAFTQNNSKKAHERMHTGELPFKCQFCLKGFTQQSNRKTHEKRCKMNRCKKQWQPQDISGPLLALLDQKESV